MIQWFQWKTWKRGSEWGMDQGSQKQTDSDPFTCHDRSEISPNQFFCWKKNVKKKNIWYHLCKNKDYHIPVLCAFCLKTHLTSDWRFYPWNQSPWWWLCWPHIGRHSQPGRATAFDDFYAYVIMSNYLYISLHLSTYLYISISTYLYHISTYLYI